MTDQLTIILNWLNEMIEIDESKINSTKKKHEINYLEGRIKAFRETKVIIEAAQWADTRNKLGE